MSNDNSDPGVVTAIMGNATAKGFIGVLGYQWGMEKYAAVDAAKYKPLHMWQTEHRCGNYPGFTPGNPTPMDTLNGHLQFDHGAQRLGIRLGWATVYMPAS